MKLKKIISMVGSVIGIGVLSTTNAMATEITVPIKADLNTICGYVAEVIYNPNELTPVLVGSDILGDECYAKSNLSTGFLNADLVEDGRIVIGWADKSAADLKEISGIVANVVFNVNENTTATETTVSSKLFQIARYPDVMANDEINYSENFVIGKSDSDADTVESGSSVIISSGDYVVENPDLINLPGTPIIEDETVNQQDETLSATVKIE